jgi:hypothetical protein
MGYFMNQLHFIQIPLMCLIFTSFMLLNFNFICQDFTRLGLIIPFMLIIQVITM